MPGRIYPTVAEAKEIHRLLIEEFRGNLGLRDEGNKRISFALADTFLRLNGFYIEVEASEAYKFIIAAMSKGEFRFDAIQHWLSSHLKPL